ncbi:TFIIB-type zinc ribbon-containing protein [Nanoarchaeota archaeon]
MPPKKKKVKRAKATEEATGQRESKRRKDCPDCGSVNILFDADTEQIICHDCGLMFEEIPPEFAKRYDEIEFL